MFTYLKKRKARALYQAVITQARDPVYYTDMQVPDTLDGRYEMLCLVSAMVMIRLKDFGSAGDSLAQSLFDMIFKHAERSLREMGIGDMGIPRRMKKMMQGFNGRARALDKALASPKPQSELKAYLSRNLYASNADAQPGVIDEMSRVCQSYAESLRKLSYETFLSGDLPDMTLQIRSRNNAG